MSETQSIPCTIFDHLLWVVEAADGSWGRAEIAPGECLLLFTSLDSVHAFIDGCEEAERAGLKPAVFSRSRREFGARARRAVRGGVVGGLFDPTPGTGEAPFLRFSRLRV